MLGVEVSRGCVAVSLIVTIVEPCPVCSVYQWRRSNGRIFVAVDTTSFCVMVGEYEKTCTALKVEFWAFDGNFNF